MSFKLEWRGEFFKGAVKTAAKMAILKSGLDLKQKSSDAAPVDFGDLRGNCAVDDSKLEQLTVRVGYSLIYALVQHEDLMYDRRSKSLVSKKLNHPKGGGPKFLESPFQQNLSRYKLFIADEIRKVFK